MASAKPLRLPFSAHEKVWGSTQLQPFFEADGKKIGEIWFAKEETAPLLVKFIFTSEDLSVQVHPGDSYARTNHACLGKTEMWQIIRAEPGARLALGTTRPLSADELRRTAESGEIMDLLRWVPAVPGDTWLVPAGTIHAIGAGIALCEVQQQSDVTYRLYDYGRPRELHLDHAMEVSDTSLQPVASAGHAACQYFRAQAHRVNGELTLQAPPERNHLLAVLSGEGALGDQVFRAGELWKFNAEQVTLSGHGAEILHVHYPTT